MYRLELAPDPSSLFKRDAIIHSPMSPWTLVSASVRSLDISSQARLKSQSTDS